MIPNYCQNLTALAPMTRDQRLALADDIKTFGLAQAVVPQYPIISWKYDETRGIGIPQAMPITPANLAGDVTRTEFAIYDASTGLVISARGLLPLAQWLELP